MTEEKPFTPAAPKLGQDVFFRDPLHGHICPAKIVNAEVVTPEEEREKNLFRVNLVVFHDGSGYCEARNKVAQGRGKGQWWHSLSELEAECILAKRNIKLTQ